MAVLGDKGDGFTLVSFYVMMIPASGEHTRFIFQANTPQGKTEVGQGRNLVDLKGQINLKVH